TLWNSRRTCGPSAMRRPAGGGATTTGRPSTTPATTPAGPSAGSEGSEHSMVDGRTSGLVTLLFTDLVGSTELLARLGDDAADGVGGAAEGGQILTSERVAGRVGSRGGFRFRPAGRLRLKGLPEPLAAVTVDWRPVEPASPDGTGGPAGTGAAPGGSGTAPRRAATAAPGPRGPQLVGRERELGLLESELERAAAGEFRGAL